MDFFLNLQTQRNCSEDNSDFLFTENNYGRFYAYKHNETEKYLACFCNGTDSLSLSPNKDNTCKFKRNKYQ